MLLGGGGYTPRNVARCWTYETSIVVGGDELTNDLPFNDYYEYFAPGYKLHLPTQKNLPNTNGAAYLEQTKQIALQQLNQLEAVPSVPIFTGQEGTTQIPRSGQDLDARAGVEKDRYDPNGRVTGEMLGKKEARGEYSSSKNSSKQLEEAALGWKTAPQGEPEEDGL
jgi:histone deacetylase 1/2|tara:strand:- start:129 stop:629 length:501 start_codon:yes stop_codon:yes gene_type:complete